MKKQIFCLLITLLALETKAQKFSLDDAVWWRGQVVLEEDTLKVMFQFNVETNALKTKDAEGIIKTYSAQKITSFEFYDPNWKQKRFFETLLYSKKRGGYETPTFFQVLTKGKKASVLMREINNQSVWLDLNTLSKPNAEFFIQTADENIHPFRGSRKQLSQILNDRKDDIEAYIKNNNLDTEMLNDFLRIVGYYNQI